MINFTPEELAALITIIKNTPITGNMEHLTRMLLLLNGILQKLEAARSETGPEV